MDSALRTLLGPGAFRMILAMMVFISHVSVWPIGAPAVTVFLMLSGYWVSHIYLDRKYDGVGAYLMGRVLRLWPMVIVAAIVALAIQIAASGETIGNFWSTLFFLGLASRQDDTVGTVWSLDIELQFYIVLPLVLAGLAMAGPRWKATLLVGTLVSLGLGILLGRHGAVTALLFAPAFAAGIWLMRSQWVPSQKLAMLSLAAFVIALATYARLLSPGTRKLMALDISYFNVGTLLIAITVIPFVAWNVHVRSDKRDRWLGDLSYPFYLLHYPIIYGLVQLMGHSLQMKALALAVTILLTVLVNKLIDQPLERWRRSLLSARTVPAE